MSEASAAAAVPPTNGPALAEVLTQQLKGLLEAGWDVEIPKASMYIWAEIPEPYRAAGSLEFAKRMLADAKVAVSPGIGFGDYGDSHVRFALIENEQRIREAVSGIKEMFRKDGLMPKAAA